jgi:putative oxidoreductase
VIYPARGLLPEISVQRLFSTFANGLPGLGLLLQRILIAAVLVSGAASHGQVASHLTAFDPPMIDAIMGILLLIGLWTPAVGTAVAVRGLWIVFSGGDAWMPLVVALLGATLAMIGPGAWSIDARLFGRKQIKRLP